MLERFLLVWLVALSSIAYAWPIAGVPFDPFVGSRPALPYMLAATMFCIGGLLPRDEIRHVLRRWPTILGGTTVQYTIMPLLALLVATIFPLEESIRIGVILVGCVPGAMASNVLTLAARGNVSYSVSLTTSATILSPVMVPVVMFATIRATGIDRIALVLDAARLLALQVVGPVVVGHIAAQCAPRVERLFSHWGSTIANSTILWIIAVVVGLNRDRLAEAGPQLVVVLTLINVAGYAAGRGGAMALKLSPGMARALTLEVGMQNAGLGSVLAGQLFPDKPLIALAPALYTFGCMLTGTVLAQYWARRPVPDAAPSS